jgi:probable HAF family extracellular repeat protein
MNSSLVGSRFAVASMFVMALGALPRPATASPYTFKKIDVPLANETDVQGINNAGQIVGFFFDGTGEHGFVDTGGVFTPINDPSLGVTSTAAHSINSLGQIVGAFNTTSCPFPATGCPGTQGFLDVAGVFTTIDFPGAFSSEAAGINDGGQIVGTFNNAAGVRLQNGIGDQGFFRSAGGVFTPINVPFAGAKGTEAIGINNAGNIVGAFQDAAGTPHGFLDVGGLFSTIDPPGAVAAIVGGINNLGQMEGVYVDAGMALHNFIDVGGVFTTVDNPFGPFSTLGGINDAGQFVGSYNDATGTARGFLATPTTVPEPASLFLVGSGVLAALRSRRGRSSRTALR